MSAEGFIANFSPHLARETSAQGMVAEQRNVLAAKIDPKIPPCAAKTKSNVSALGEGGGGSSTAAARPPSAEFWAWSKVIGVT